MEAVSRKIKRGDKVRLKSGMSERSINSGTYPTYIDPGTDHEVDDLRETFSSYDEGAELTHVHIKGTEPGRWIDSRHFDKVL